MTEPAQTTSENQSALVLFSGGQDSSTCLAWALERFERVETVGFDYGQRHTIELTVRGQLRDAMRSIKPHWQNRLGDDHMINLSALGEISQTSLTRDMEMAMGSEGLPNSFVPGRNLIFLTFAAAIAYRRGIRHLVTGVCETDYSGYPDCRDDTIKAMQVALGLGMERRFVLHTPLMWIDKAQTWSLTEELGGSALIGAIRDISHSCYLGERKAHDWGHGCGHCPACELRADGFMRWRKAAK
jgi:7-cyano-7-deazaguanine synthase